MIDISKRPNLLKKIPIFLVNDSKAQIFLMPKFQKIFRKHYANKSLSCLNRKVSLSLDLPFWLCHWRDQQKFKQAKCSWSWIRNYQKSKRKGTTRNAITIFGNNWYLGPKSLRPCPNQNSDWKTNNLTVLNSGNLSAALSPRTEESTSVIDFVRVLSIEKLHVKTHLASLYRTSLRWNLHSLLIEIFSCLRIPFLRSPQTLVKKHF